MTRRRFLLGAGATALATRAFAVQEGEADDSASDTKNSSINLREEKIAGSTRSRRPADGDETETNGEQQEENTEEEEEDEAELETPLIGANLNGRPRHLTDNLQLLDASNTTWVRAFFDIRRKNTNGIPPQQDPDVLALRKAAKQKDCKLIVSLKWDFKVNWGGKAQMRVPRAGSKKDRELRRVATRYLRHIGAPVDVVVLGNEPMWETLPGDIKVDDPPIVRFTRDVKDHLVRHGDHGDSTYLVGSLNRTHDDETREKHFPQFHRQMFRMVREDDDIDGVDLHIHFEEFAEAEKSVAIARDAVPDGTITATEFSPIWRYDRHKNTPLTELKAGKQLVATTDLPTDMTVAKYFQRAKSDPPSRRELSGFYRSMPWYNTDHVDDMYDLFAKHDVSVGTMGFVQTPRMRHEDWTSGWSPFHINFLYQPALLHPDTRIEDTALPEYINDYRKHAA